MKDARKSNVLKNDHMATSLFFKALPTPPPSSGKYLHTGLWNIHTYLDLHFFQKAELPMDVDYAEYLIEATLWHHIVDLAVQADKLAVAK